MKKTICILILIALCLSTAALAQTDRCESAESFLRALEETGIPHMVQGLTETGEEHIHLSAGEGGVLCGVEVLFSPDNDRVTLRAEGLATFDAASRTQVLMTLNELNFSYKYVRFYAAEDATVVCAMDLILPEGGDAGDVTLEGLMRLDSILRHAMPQLEAFGK